MEKRLGFFNREITCGGKCILSGVLASLALTLMPLDAAVLTADQATFVQNGEWVDRNFGSQTNVQVANRSAAVRKTYLDFNLTGQLGSGEAFTSSSLAITTTATPLIGTASGSVTFSIYGLVNGGTWSEADLTWNTSDTVGNDLSSNTGVIASATTLLGTITIDTNTIGSGQTFTLSSSALVQYLNWAAGTLGDIYQTGVVGGLTPTFIITAQGTAVNSAGVNFASDDFATASSRPSLAFTTAPVPEPGTLGLAGLGVGSAFLLRMYSRRRTC